VNISVIFSLARPGINGSLSSVMNDKALNHIDQSRLQDFLFMYRTGTASYIKNSLLVFSILEYMKSRSNNFQSFATMTILSVYAL